MNKKKWRLLFIISCILLSSCFGRDFPVRLRSSFSTPLHDGMEMNLELSGLGAQEPKNLLNFPSSQNLKRQTTQVLKNTAAALAQELKFAPVELILQNPELPNGCEVTSLAMLLTSAGFPVDHVKLYQQYLPTKEFTYSKNQRLGPSPNEFYVGDASSRTGGWYCFESPIIEAGNAWIQANGGGRQDVVADRHIPKRVGPVCAGRDASRRLGDNGLYASCLHGFFQLDTAKRRTAHSLQQPALRRLGGGRRRAVPDCRPDEWLAVG